MKYCSLRVVLISILVMLLLTPVVCLAWGPVSVGQSALAVDAGQRTDQLDWNIAGTSAGTGPNILSELTWKDLQIIQFRVHGELDLVIAGKPWFRPHLRGNLGFGQIYSGQNQDSDYDGDNRTQEFSRSNNAADQGDVLDLSLGVGQRFSFLEERLALTPLLGYSYHQQNLRMLDGYQTIETLPHTPPVGPFERELDSSYDTEWRGPWLGLEIRYLLNNRLLIKGLSEYHRATYAAEANWNLRTDFAHPLSFAQSADGHGWVHEVGLEFPLRERLSLSLSGTYQRWQTDTGRDRVFLANGTISDTRLNRVNWTSASVQGGLSYAF